MMNNDQKLDLDKLAEERMEFHEVLISPDGKNPAVLVMIHDLSPEVIKHVVRVYSLKEDGNKFVLDAEIVALHFLIVYQLCRQLISL